jgi:Domain of unknown function (DUF5063)
MADDGLDDLIAEYFALLNDANASEEDSLGRLVDALDRLCAAARHAEYTFEDDHPDPPERDYLEAVGQFRQLARRRFPDLEPYNVPHPIAGGAADARILVCDPYDDIADIACDLATVEWALGHTSINDALWHLSNSYLTHWGEHANNLRWYLFARAHDL